MTKKSAIIFLVLLIFAVTFFLVFNNEGYIRTLKMKGQLDSIKTEIDLTKSKIIELKNEIDSLKNNKEILERVAREKYNFKKTNETVIDIDLK